jgi:alkanesulfonate monooxygenase SsuD/methylene tetrahydromethanopterin reductase-like flavin-dependent oxidoreductase (luciferase family)
MLSFMIGGYGPFYGDVVAEQGYADAVEAIRDAWDERDTAAMAAALPDEILDGVAAAGTPEAVRQRVRAFASIDGVDAARVGFVAGMSDQQKTDTLAALEPLTGA